MHSDILDVVCLRNVKREGRLLVPGTALRMTRGEFLQNPGLYRAASEPAQDLEGQALERKKAQEEADRAEKLKRIEQERILREEQAARQVALIEQAQQRAKAAQARAAQARKGDKASA